MTYRPQYSRSSAVGDGNFNPAIPGPLGNTTPSTGKFTTLHGFDTGSQVYNAQAYGWLPDGTDRSIQALALLATVYAANGGVIWFPPSAGKYRADSQLYIPNNGVSSSNVYASQPSVTLAGVGGGPKWFQWDIVPEPLNMNSSTLDLRYAGASGKILTQGQGNLTIDGLCIVDGGSSNAGPFVWTTMTALTIRNSHFQGTGNAGQHFIICGGPDSGFTGVYTDAYQAYGTTIECNSFRNGASALICGSYANCITFAKNSVFDGAVGNATAVIDSRGRSNNKNQQLRIRDNIFEIIKGYLYGVKLKNTQFCLFDNNGFWDRGFSSVYLYDYYFDDNVSGYNTFINTECELIGAIPTQQTWGYNAGAGGAFSLDFCTIIGNQDGMTNTSSDGLQSSEFSSGAIIKGYYKAAKRYPGQLIVTVPAHRNYTVSIGFDDINQLGVIDAKSGYTNGTALVLNPSGGNVVCGPTPLTTNATTGFLNIPTCAGTPTGTPTNYGGSPLVYDTTNNKLYAYNGAWKSVTFT